MRPEKKVKKRGGKGGEKGEKYNKKSSQPQQSTQPSPSCRPTIWMSVKNFPPTMGRKQKLIVSLHSRARMCVCVYVCCAIRTGCHLPDSLLLPVSDPWVLPRPDSGPVCLLPACLPRASAPRDLPCKILEKKKER